MSDQQELIPMRPGDLLRQVREQRKISLERAAEASRIRLRVLAAIESGDTETIPTVYLRGYVRNYARFLGVDPADRQLDRQHLYNRIRPIPSGRLPHRVAGAEQGLGQLVADEGDAPLEPLVQDAFVGGVLVQQDEAAFGFTQHVTVVQLADHPQVTEFCFLP